MSQYDDMIVAAESILNGHKVTSNHRSNTQNRKKLRGDLKSEDVVRYSFSGKIPRSIFINSYMLKFRIIFVPIFESAS